MSEQKQAYGQILKSSSIVGGAQVVSLLIGMIRVKFVAVLLGTTGTGLQAVFISIQEMAITLSGLGINNSGVRDVAEAAGSEDTERIGHTVLTLRRMCWLTGTIGALLLAVFAHPINDLSFPENDYTLHIRLLSLSVLIGSISAGQMALIQGMRRIGDLAKLNVITAVVGSFIAVGLFWWLGMDGIIPSLLSLSIVSLISSWWFSRRIKLCKVSMNWRETFVFARSLVTLGMTFVWTGVLTVVLAYVTRILITQEVNIAAVGVYTAAFALSGMFLNFVLGAMGADFYPSLTAVSQDHKKMRDLVNQQTEVGLLLAVPGLLATLALAPWIIRVFYTAEFIESAELLQWFVLGCLGRVISWPMAFIILAKGKGLLFAIFETAFNLLHLALIWIGLRWVGVEGVAIAFCLLYIVYTFGLMVIARQIIDFHWSNPVWRLLVGLLPVAVTSMVQSRFLPLGLSTLLGVIITAGVSVYCLRGLCSRLEDDHPAVKVAKRLPFAKSWLIG